MKVFTLSILLFIITIILSAYATDDEEEIALNQPEGICYDSEDNLYVADTGNNRVLIFDPSLKVIFRIENKKDVALNEPGQLNAPADVAVDSAGRIIVAERGNHRLQIFSPKGESLKTLGKKDKNGKDECKPGTEDGEFNSPTHITIDDRDNIIVTERWNHRIQVFNKDGKHLFTYANRTGERAKEILDEMLKKEKNPENLPADWKEWKKTDPGQLNEPGGTFYDAKLKRLYLGNGWNCRIEVFDYDSKSGKITRRPEEQGIVWGFWTIRSVAGDSQGRLIGTDSNFANLGIFNDRADLTNKSQRVKTVTGGSFGEMKGVFDIAINSKDDVAVADTSNSRIIIFDKNFTIPEDPRVPEITSSSADISWETPSPALSKIRILKAKYPMKTPGYENLWKTEPDNVREFTASAEKKTGHKIQLTKLEPGTRYYYQVFIPSLRIIPNQGWSREYAFGTLGSKGTKAYLAMPVKIFLRCNIIDAASVKPDSPKPEPMTPEDIALYKRDLEETRLFYWNNSSMQYLIDYDLYIDSTMTREGNLPDDAPQWLKELPEHGIPQEKLMEEAGKYDRIYYGVVYINAKRGWDANRKKWHYYGSGGGTHGINWPGLGSSDFLGGSDIAWLMCHEYHHQVESQYGNSGLNREDDRMIFCHFAPVHKGWEWSTAYKHGEHWDGIAYSLRVFKPSQYLRNLYGEIRIAKDADGDGIPDDDPALPMDEKRFNSDPTKLDTDEDGLNDMQEILASKWVTCLNADLRDKISAGYIRPNPRNKDTDGDGVEDGKDKYPIYPFPPVVSKGGKKVDGDIAEWGDKPQFFMNAHGLNLKGWTAHDENFLYGAFSVEGDFADMNLVFDFDADGFYVGVDNLYMWISPDIINGPKLRDAKLHICGSERWPYFDEKDKETGRYKYINPDEIKWASAVKDGAQIFELAVPKKQEIGLELKQNEEIGMMLYITPKDKSAISLFEPWSIFFMNLE